MGSIKELLSSIEATQAQQKILEDYLREKISVNEENLTIPPSTFFAWFTLSPLYRGLYGAFNQWLTQDPQSSINEKWVVYAIIESSLRDDEKMGLLLKAVPESVQSFNELFSEYKQLVTNEFKAVINDQLLQLISSSTLSSYSARLKALPENKAKNQIQKEFRALLREMLTKVIGEYPSTLEGDANIDYQQDILAATNFIKNKVQQYNIRTSINEINQPIAYFFELLDYTAQDLQQKKEDLQANGFIIEHSEPLSLAQWQKIHSEINVIIARVDESQNTSILPLIHQWLNEMGSLTQVTSLTKISIIIDGDTLNLKEIVDLWAECLTPDVIRFAKKIQVIEQNDLNFFAGPNDDLTHDITKLYQFKKLIKNQMVDILQQTDSSLDPASINNNSLPKAIEFFIEQYDKSRISYKEKIIIRDVLKNKPKNSGTASLSKGKSTKVAKIEGSITPPLESIASERVAESRERSSSSEESSPPRRTRSLSVSSSVSVTEGQYYDVEAPKLKERLNSITQEIDTYLNKSKLALLLFMSEQQINEKFPTLSNTTEISALDVFFSKETLKLPSLFPNSKLKATDPKAYEYATYFLEYATAVDEELKNIQGVSDTDIPVLLSDKCTLLERKRVENDKIKQLLLTIGVAEESIPDSLPEKRKLLVTEINKNSEAISTITKAISTRTIDDTGQDVSKFEDFINNMKEEVARLYTYHEKYHQFANDISLPKMITMLQTKNTALESVLSKIEQQVTDKSKRLEEPTDLEQRTRALLDEVRTLARISGITFSALDNESVDARNRAMTLLIIPSITQQALLEKNFNELLNGLANKLNSIYPLTPPNAIPTPPTIDWLLERSAGMFKAVKEINIVQNLDDNISKSATLAGVVGNLTFINESFLNIQKVIEDIRELVAKATDAGFTVELSATEKELIGKQFKTPPENSSWISDAQQIMAIHERTTLAIKTYAESNNKDFEDLLVSITRHNMGDTKIVDTTISASITMWIKMINALDMLPKDITIQEADFLTTAGALKYETYYKPFKDYLNNIRALNPSEHDDKNNNQYTNTITTYISRLTNPSSPTEVNLTATEKNQLKLLYAAFSIENPNERLANQSLLKKVAVSLLEMRSTQSGEERGQLFFQWRKDRKIKKEDALKKLIDKINTPNNETLHDIIEKSVKEDSKLTLGLTGSRTEKLLKSLMEISSSRSTVTTAQIENYTSLKLR